MKTYKCTVERTDEYIVEFDESVINEEWMGHFREYFYDYYTLEEHAQHIAQHRARFGITMIEGYGIPLEDGVAPYWLDERSVNHAINIKTVREDADLFVYSKEVL